ncbi:hypothetical protein [Halalkalicoccus jeotgali]|uniref:Uncharacterized protein n=1 Tax=Halalkalicoccus jeotgali (strain DSM 18796 / CECT 7217 / JCM 14584 / KCTC 4019 / B3) TaxID=795797 RepID=D8J9Y6_HALJB|nr:hypothetical protein [Halalkalicoccus jeotgali]ADJ14508.1 hypothetical protein HacjB3_05585 [Halalkalicoccus jeotgali B3]ELY40081.1 hypothetical protein C497_03955 [Halalkalicoccus jeotgali B3]
MEVVIMLNNMSTGTNSNVTTQNSSDGAGETDGDSPTATPPHDYDLSVILRTIGNASSTCECCGTVVDGTSLGDWIIVDLDEVDFSDESHALVCLDCHGTEEWEMRVRQNRRDQQINTRLDEVIHWVSRGPVKTLFARRAAAGIVLLFAATALTTIMTAFTSGLVPTLNYLDTANISAIVLAGTILLVGSYWLHLHEREKNDHRGTTVQEFNFSDGPWSVLAIASAGLVGGALTVPLASTSGQFALGLSMYIASGIIGFTNLETAVRADRCCSRVDWVPRYDRELFVLRMSVATGIASLVVGVTVGALLPIISIPAYLFARKWYDLGPNWELLQHSRGGDE